MKILNFGSLNIDDVYQVDHIVRPGETITSGGYRLFCGGKGLNQSVALAHAGAEVYHAGKIGPDGGILKERLDRAGVRTGLVMESETPTGHAIIQVNREGENSIILFSGANRTLTEGEIDGVLSRFSPGDYILLQNEVNLLDTIIQKASDRGMIIALNPSPMDEKILSLPLDRIGIFILNEVEGEGFTGKKAPEEILAAMTASFPGARIFLTLGASGVRYAGPGETASVPAIRVTPVDTTAAGDTFTGYLLTALAEGRAVETAMKEAVAAAAVTVTRPGASDSIPRREELNLPE